MPINLKDPRAIQAALQGKKATDPKSARQLMEAARDLHIDLPPDHPVAVAARMAESDRDLVTCPTCKGDGKIRGNQMKCPDCGGEGKLSKSDAAKLAELTSKARGKLPNSSFAYVDAQGTGHFPLSDKAHVSNALARFTQHSFPDAGTKAKAARKIKAKASSMGVEVADDSPVAKAAKMSEPLIIALPFAEVQDEDFAEGRPLPFLRIGEHQFGDYGDVNIDDAALDKVVENFHNNVRRQDLPVVINEEHIPVTYDEAGDVQQGPGAIGFMKDLYRDGDTVYLVPEWNAAGERIMADDRYRGGSPELMLDWVDPETLDHHGMTAVAYGLTNRPRMKNLAVQGAPLDPGLVAASQAYAEPRILAFADTADVHVDAPLTNLSVAYGYPQKQRLPLHSKEAVIGAKARFMTVDASEDERDDAWGRIVAAASEHGINLPTSWRELQAAEVAQAYMADATGGPAPVTDDVASDIASGMLAPCVNQPPYSSCPGYTRSDPDGDGDADACAMAGRGCNGYLPMTAGATPTVVQAAPTDGWYSEAGRIHKELSMADSKFDPDGDGDDDSTPSGDTDNSHWTPDGKLTALGKKTNGPWKKKGMAEGEEAAEGEGTTEAVETPETEPTAVADFEEARNVILAEQKRSARLEARLALAEGQAKGAVDELSRMRAAAKLDAAESRIAGLVRSGRVTPAEVEKYTENLAKFAEETWYLEALEARPANSAVDMSERGSGSTEVADSDSERLHQAALSRMREMQQETSGRGKAFHENYKAALLHVGRLGYKA